MPPAIWLVPAFVGSLLADSSSARQVPSYSAASVVNAASNHAGAYAPNAFLTIYGQNLAFSKPRSLTLEDLTGGLLPSVLAGTGVRVWLDFVPASVFYVSPTQINVLIPPNLKPGPTQIRVQLDSTYGPSIPIVLTKAAPALFQVDSATAIAAHANGSLLTADDPGKPGEVVVMYATGLGETNPNAGYGEIPRGAAQLADMPGFEIRFDGKPLDARRVLYAGVAPGFAGLYQINLQLPDEVGTNPEVRIIASGASSPEGIRIPVRP